MLNHIFYLFSIVIFFISLDELIRSKEHKLFFEKTKKEESLFSHIIHIFNCFIVIWITIGIYSHNRLLFIICLLLSVFDIIIESRKNIKNVYRKNLKIFSRLYFIFICIYIIFCFKFCKTKDRKCWI